MQNEETYLASTALKRKSIIAIICWNPNRAGLLLSSRVALPHLEGALAEHQSLVAAVLLRPLEDERKGLELKEEREQERLMLKGV